MILQIAAHLQNSFDNIGDHDIVAEAFTSLFEQLLHVFSKVHRFVRCQTILAEATSRMV